jgi:hypothetical protein
MDRVGHEALSSAPFVAGAVRWLREFTRLVRRYWDPDTGEAEATLERAVPRLGEPADSHVEGLTGDTRPLRRCGGAVANVGLDEIIISTLPGRVSRWLRRDLPHRVQEFRLLVSVVRQSHPIAPCPSPAGPARSGCDDRRSMGVVSVVSEPGSGSCR